MTRFVGMACARTTSWPQATCKVLPPIIKPGSDCDEVSHHSCVVNNSIGDSERRIVKYCCEYNCGIYRIFCPLWHTLLTSICKRGDSPNVSYSHYKVSHYDWAPIFSNASEPPVQITSKANDNVLCAAALNELCISANG